MGNVMASQSAGSIPPPSITPTPTITPPTQQENTADIKKPVLLLEDGPGTFEDLHKKCKGL